MAIDYARAGGPPDDWFGLRVFDEDGNEVEDVVECNAKEGWLIRYKRNADGQLYASGDEAASERIEGRFYIGRLTNG